MTDNDYMDDQQSIYDEHDNMTKEYSEPPTQMNASKQKTLTALLDQIEQRANAATPGPWRADDKSVHFSIAIRPGATGFLIASLGRDNMLYRGDKARQVEPDADFIAAARSDVPALVKALRQQSKTLEGIRTMLERQPLGCLGDGHDNAGNHWPVRDEVIYNINKALSADLLREPADSVQTTERAWLIEKGPTHLPKYLRVSECRWDWTTDSNEALRFVRSEDAEQVMTHFLLSHAECRVAEHAWDDFCPDAVEKQRAAPVNPSPAASLVSSVERDAQRLDWLEGHCFTNREGEREIHFDFKGTLREAIDKALENKKA